MTSRVSAVVAWLRRREWAVVGGLAVTAFGLGLAGLRRMQGDSGAWSWPDGIYFALRLFTFETDLGNSEIDPYVFDAGNWQLQVARFLAPLTLALAVLKAVMLAMTGHYNLWRISRWRGHAVVCGAGERGRQLALALRAEGKNVVVIEKDENCDTLADIRAAGGRVVIGSVTDPARQREARLDTASVVAAVTPCIESNLQVVLAASRRDNGLPVHALAYAPRSFAAMFESQPPFARIERGRECGFFDHDAAAARLIVGRCAPDLVPTLLRERRSPRILVVGDGDLVPELLAVLVTQCQFAAAGVPRVDLVTVDVDAVAREFPLHHPQLGLVADLHVTASSLSRLLGMEAVGAPAAGARYDLAFVACREDSDALAIARNLAQQRESVAGRVVAGLRPSTQLMRLFTVSQPLPGVELVDLVALGCSADIVLRGGLDAVARGIHESYVRGQLQAGRRPGETAALVAWEELPEGMRQANRAQADHGPIKRRTLAESASAETIEQLAEAEHRRWMAERIVAGWRFAPTRDDARRLHPSIRPYAELSEADKAKDRDTVRAVMEPMAGPADPVGPPREGR